MAGCMMSSNVIHNEVFVPLIVSPYQQVSNFYASSGSGVRSGQIPHLDELKNVDSEESEGADRIPRSGYFDSTLNGSEGSEPEESERVVLDYQESFTSKHTENEHDVPEKSCDGEELNTSQTGLPSSQPSSSSGMHHPIFDNWVSVSKTSNKPYSCEVCRKEFKTFSAVKRHLSTHNRTVKASYKCEICQKELASFSSLKSHMKLHSRDKPKCEVCHKHFSTGCALAIHKKFKCPDKPIKLGQLYQCEICNKKYRIPSLLEAHMKLHDAQNSNLHQCHICMKKFRSLTYLQAHVASHSKERRFKCEICQKSFPESWRLANHKMIHTGEKPYQCELCGKRFATPHALKAHVKTHNKDKQYQCHICGKMLSGRRHLDEHLIRIHIVKGELDSLSSAGNASDVTATSV